MWWSCKDWVRGQARSGDLWIPSGSWRVQPGGAVSACSSTELPPTSTSPPPSPGLTVPHGSARAVVSPPVDPQIWKGRIGGLSWLCDAWFQASAAPKKERSHLATCPSWLEMIKLGKFPAFFGCKSQILFFAYFLKLTPIIKSLYVENDQIWNILQNFTLEGCENSRFVISTVLFLPKSL